MIKSVKLCINHSSRVRKLDINKAKLHFNPGYNVLIGPNGSGKSTVLKALASCPMCELDGIKNRNPIKYVTTETLNPLVGGSFSTREEMIQGIRAMFQSHGQGVWDSLMKQSHVKETVLLVDSPETGQDHENSLKIHKGLLRMSMQYQVIIATNSLVFMKGGNLIDLGNNYYSKLIKETGKLVVSLGFLTKTTDK